MGAPPTFTQRTSPTVACSLHAGANRVQITGIVLGAETFSLPPHLTPVEESRGSHDCMEATRDRASRWDRRLIISEDMRTEMSFQTKTFQVSFLHFSEFVCLSGKSPHCFCFCKMSLSTVSAFLLSLCLP